MLLIYSDIDSSRIRYILETVFTDWLKISYSVTNDLNYFKTAKTFKLSYCLSRVADEFFIRRNDLLAQSNVTIQKVEVVDSTTLILLFPTHGSDLPFDLFASIFYMISRYEEYLPYTPDKNGRFSASSSLAYKYKFLELPVVNLWIRLFSNKLKDTFPQILPDPGEFNALLTYDIDVAYAFRGRGFIRNSVSILKDIVTFKFQRLVQRAKVAKGVIFDPWDTYTHILSLTAHAGLDAIFFFLVGDYSVKNKNLLYSSSEMRDLINSIAGKYEIGLHPSYSSSQNPGLIKEEKNRLETISGKRITKSRQHYLKFTLPSTYRYLIDAGITEDYSMGFADAPGFRAGCCLPFYFYDLERETRTELKVFPVTLMEGNFQKYQKLTPAEAIPRILNLINQVKEVKGTFISIWHNHTVSDHGMYKGWKNVHDEMVNALSSNNQL